MNLEQMPESFFRSTGCVSCGHSGYSKRRFLLDVLTFNDDLIKAFDQSSDVTALEKHLGLIAYKGGAEEGLQLLMAGEVSPDEYISAVVL